MLIKPPDVAEAFADVRSKAAVFSAKATELASLVDSIVNGAPDEGYDQALTTYQKSEVTANDAILRLPNKYVSEDDIEWLRTIQSGPPAVATAALKAYEAWKQTSSRSSKNK